MRVTKYNASGNDFIIFHDSIKKDRSQLAKNLCNRHMGVGADGMVVLLPHEKYDFEWEFYNADGSSAAMCGNASRAVAHYACKKGISVDNFAEFLTGAGVIRAKVNGDYVISDMLPPKILRQDIIIDDEIWWLIDTGVPHLVAICENIDDFDIKKAKKLRDTYDANVNISKITNDGKLYVRTYERGVEDETLACGTGMVACFVRAFNENKIASKIQVLPRSKEDIDVQIDDGVYQLGGRVKKVFVAELSD